MRRVLLGILVVLTSLALSACDVPLEIVEVEKVVTETEVVEIEVPVIITEKEIQIEVVEVPTTVFQIEESRTVFWVGDGSRIIFVASRGEVSYTIEFLYEDPLIGGPYMTVLQIEKQLDGYTDDWFFSEDITGCTEEELEVLTKFPVENEYDFEWQVYEFNDTATWEDLEHMYQSYYDNYYYGDLFDGCTAGDSTT